VSQVLATLQSNPALVGKPGAPGAQGPPGPAGPAGAPAPATAASQPIPFLYREKNPDGTFTPVVNLLTTDKTTGKPVYQLEVDKSQSASTVVPVAPLPGK
jgi:hypothetical protein